MADLLEATGKLADAHRACRGARAAMETAKELVDAAGEDSSEILAAMSLLQEADEGIARAVGRRWLELTKPR